MAVKKVCSKCKTEKPVAEFGKDRSRSDGLRSYCRQCQRDYDKSKNNPPRTTGTKTCSKCKTEKPVAEFSKQKSSSDGLRAQCRQCQRVYDKSRNNPPCMTGTKTCGKCKTEKPVAEFCKDRSRSDGRNWKCKECAVAYLRPHVANKRKEANEKRERMRSYHEVAYNRIASASRTYYESRQESLAVLQRFYCESSSERIAERREGRRLARMFAYGGSIRRAAGAGRRDRETLLGEMRSYCFAVRELARSLLQAERERQKAYRDATRDERNARRRAHRKENPGLRKAQREAARAKDPVGYRVRRRLRNRLHNAIASAGTRKHASALAFGLPTLADLRAYIEAQFVQGMTWENIEVDHWMPLKCPEVDLHNPHHQRALCHYTNLRPMWPVANNKKSNAVYPDAYANFLRLVAMFEAERKTGQQNLVDSILPTRYRQTVTKGIA